MTTNLVQQVRSLVLKDAANGGTRRIARLQRWDVFREPSLVV